MYNLKRNYDNIKDQQIINKKYEPLKRDYSQVICKPLQERKQKNIQKYNLDFIPQQIDKNHNRINENQIKNRHQESRQLHWYLKEYQYNNYQPENQERKSLNSLKFEQKYKIQSVQKDLKKSEYDSKYHQMPQSRYSLNYSAFNLSFSQDRQLNKNQNKQNILMNNESLSLINPIAMSSSKNQRLLNKETIQSKNFISKQQIVLLKHLREQNNELKMQLSKKNCYIKDLQQKLQKYLKQRIQGQNQASSLCKKLQNKLQEAHQQIIKLQKEIVKLKQTKKHSQQTLQTIFKTLKINHQTETVSNFQLPKIIKILQQTLVQKNTIDDFIHKIEEMKNKIQLKSNKTQLIIQKQQIKNGKNLHSSKNKSLNLKQLWKWLKKVAKQYEVMKQKVSQMQKDQNISKN